MWRITKDANIVVGNIPWHLFLGKKVFSLCTDNIEWWILFSDRQEPI